MTELGALGLRWESAGPHHLLGIGPDGAEIDLVGVPLEQAVISVPADAAEAGVRRYLAPIASALDAPNDLDAWVSDQLGGWDGATNLEADATLGAVDVRLRSTPDPAYLVLTLSGA